MQGDREDVGGRDIFVRESFQLSQSLVLWPRVPMIWRMVVLETEITETKEGFMAIWSSALLLAEGKRDSTGIDASPGRGKVLGVVQNCTLSVDWQGSVLACA